MNHRNTLINKLDDREAGSHGRTEATERTPDTEPERSRPTRNPPFARIAAVGVGSSQTLTFNVFFGPVGSARS